MNFILPSNLRFKCEFKFTKKIDEDWIPICHLSN